MLQTLHIQNFALIEELHASFGEGVTIFTGETGAGKSILLDAIGMLAGKRASAEFVRQGAEAFLVEGAFFFENDPALTEVLDQNHITCEEGQLVISRQFHRNGRGSILVNGTLVPTNTVRKIGAFLLDIHGQYDNKLIFDAAYHATLLDNLTPPLQEARRTYQERYRQWRHLRSDVEKMKKDDSEKARLMSVLHFQIAEISDARLKEGEDDDLEDKINRLSHAEKIKDSLRHMVYLLDGTDRHPGIVEQLSQLRTDLERSSSYDEAFREQGSKAETLSYEIEDIRDTLSQYADEFNFDENELDALQGRLATIEKLKRKYGYSIVKIQEFLQQAREEWNRLDQSESVLVEMEADLAQLEIALRQSSDQLMGLRKEADALFRRQMKETMARLGMTNSRIGFHIEPMTAVNREGADSIELYFTANKGENPQPLAKIASGGEVSRIALALKTCSHEAVSGKTIIFDEIDVGISGQTGLQVAAHIRKLREAAQVFCITHLPQTAAIADQHDFLYKAESDGRTVTQLRQLSPQEHIREIARMFAGDHPSEESVETARQLIRQVHQDC